MPATRRALPAAVSAALLAVLAGALPAQAHNAKVHLAMTDRAYEIMIALSTGALPTSGDAALAQLAVDAGKAIPKLQALPAGLPPPRQALCIDPEVIKRHGQNPAWGGAGRFEDIALGSVRFPLALEYITGNDCGIDPFWSPGAFFDTVNVVPPGTPHGHRDHTGQVLGFWAHQPDDEEDDWHLFLVRPSNAAGFSEIKDYIETAGGAGAGAVWVTVRCAMECIGDVLGLGGDCEECLDEAIADAENAVHEGITTVDGLLPGFGDISDAALLSGMGHHLNVVPGAPADYDDLAGLFFEAAGPAGQPDPVELLATMVTDAAGTTVRYDESDGPKEYEIADGRDFHPDSEHRDAEDWEYLSLPRTPFTPLDNLGFSGWARFRGAPREHVPDLGWTLHAFGDAIVPMHVAATFGWGHRPYEDAFENLLDDYLHVGERNHALAQAQRIARRALAWRQAIQSWRAEHSGRGADVPVRDLVTRLARWTFERVGGPSVFWPYHPILSTDYLVPGPTREASIAFYELAPGSEAVNRELLEEGIAAELAFLVSLAEVLP